MPDISWEMIKYWYHWDEPGKQELELLSKYMNNFVKAAGWNARKTLYIYVRSNNGYRNKGGQGWKIYRLILY